MDGLEDLTDFAGVDLPDDLALWGFLAGLFFEPDLEMTFFGFATARLVVLLEATLFLFFPLSESASSST